MQCFIHPNKGATASCTKCGKAMCVDCSSFTSHSGICPACKKVDMDKEVAALRQQIEGRKSDLKLRLTLSIIFFFLIIPLALYPAHKRTVLKEIGVLEDKIAGIQKSLRFVDEALNRGSGDLAAHSAETEQLTEDAWQCPFCRTINKSGRVCKFCSRKKP